jgi:hypothetical protein
MDLESFMDLGGSLGTWQLGRLERADFDEGENGIRDLFRWAAGTGFWNHARLSERPQHVAHSLLANSEH